MLLFNIQSNMVELYLSETTLQYYYVIEVLCFDCHH